MTQAITNDQLLDMAQQAASSAYAPYSNVHVGAALETESGEIFTGCNVENASYSMTICAERNAIFQAVAKGHTSFRRIAVWADAETLFTPCGACRQVLREFATDMPVLVGSPTETLETSLAELLPHSFSM